MTELIKIISVHHDITIKTDRFISYVVLRVLQIIIIITSW